MWSENCGTANGSFEQRNRKEEQGTLNMSVIFIM